MKSISISGSSRTEVGKKATNALRKAGLVPCCIYGVEKDENGNPLTKTFSVPVEGLRKLVYTPDIHVVDLTIDGKEVKMEVEVGAKVIYSKYAGTDVKMDDEEYIIVRQNDILAIISE